MAAEKSEITIELDNELIDEIETIFRCPPEILVRQAIEFIGNPDNHTKVTEWYAQWLREQGNSDTKHTD